MDKKVEIGATFVDKPTGHILIMLDGQRFTCFEAIKSWSPAAHGYVTKGLMRLSRNKALELAAQIFKAAGDARDMDTAYVEHEQAVHNAEVKNMQTEVKKLHAHLRDKLLPKGE